MIESALSESGASTVSAGLYRKALAGEEIRAIQAIENDAGRQQAISQHAARLVSLEMAVVRSGNAMRSKQSRASGYCRMTQAMIARGATVPRTNESAFCVIAINRDGPLSHTCA